MRHNGLGLGFGLGLAGSGARRASAAYDPALIPGALFDGDADQVVTGATMTWTDRSGNGNAPAQPIAGSQPTVTAGALGGHAALTFLPAPQFLTRATSLVAAGAAFTVLTVARSGVAGGGCLWCSRTSSPYQAALALFSGALYVASDGVHGAQNVTTAAQAITSDFYLAHVFNGAGANPTIRFNGAAVAITSSGTSQGTETGAAGWTVGAATNAQGWSGRIYRMTVVAGAMGTAAVQQWEAYVRARYGLS